IPLNVGEPPRPPSVAKVAVIINGDTSGEPCDALMPRPVAHAQNCGTKLAAAVSDMRTALVSAGQNSRAHHGAQRRLALDSAAMRPFQVAQIDALLRGVDSDAFADKPLRGRPIARFKRLDPDSDKRRPRLPESDRLHVLIASRICLAALNSTRVRGSISTGAPVFGWLPTKPRFCAMEKTPTGVRISSSGRNCASARPSSSRTAFTVDCVNP